MCANCDWEEAAERAGSVAESVPEWKTNAAAFFNSLEDSILKMEHVTPRQLECIEKGESEY